MSKFIKEYWDNQGKTFSDTHKASWEDFCCINLEIDVVSRQNCSNGKVLDVGCANGYLTLRIADICEPQRMVGVDYSESMIKSAIAALRGIKPQDEVEGMLATQMVATHAAAMECLRRSMIQKQSFEGRESSLVTFFQGNQECWDFGWTNSPFLAGRACLS